MWRASLTPEGPATTRIALEATDVAAGAWGPGARWALDHLDALIGEGDALEGFQPADPLIRELHRRHPGLRIPRTDAVLESLVPTILEQKVQGNEARAAYRRMVYVLGEPAPGPAGLRLPPSPERLARTPYWVLHRFGIERRRADCIRSAAMHAARLEEATTMSPAAAQRRLTALPGLGEWTAAEVAVLALGDADAVSVGDYHLPHLVSWNLAREPRGSDARMLELLEPYRGHRARVLRLLSISGNWAPRFGARLPVRRIESI